MTVHDKLNAIAENESKVFKAGYSRGCYDLGHEEGFAKGKLVGAEDNHSEFWDSFQQNGTRTNYSYAFAGQGWNAQTFRPKYPIVPMGLAGHSMFRNSGDIGDLEAILQECGVYLDTSNAKSLELAFAQSGVTRVGIIDATNLTSLSSVFSHATKLETIDELRIPSYTEFGNMFLNCNALKNITITGGKISRDLNLQWSTLLTPESMRNIIFNLQPYNKSQFSWQKYTITFASNCWDALEADSMSPTGTWREYVASIGWLT